ncbi:MAG: 50S ribosomal protein L15 [Candidatus Pacebacteria bacterium]|nr:50S ribosomal protein L15 [Candidatus Paceibacterota bacterium]
MQIHNLKRITKNKKTATVGRGGKRGKTSGRGGKGQTARAGHKVRPEVRDFIKRMPKLRGYAFNSKNVKASVINVADLELLFVDNELVNPSTIVKKGILEIGAGKNPKVKILSNGELTKKLEISGCLVSAGAKVKIEKAGGSVK